MSGNFFQELTEATRGSAPTLPDETTTRGDHTPHGLDLRQRNTVSGLIIEDRLSPEELAEAQELARIKYGTREWIYTLL